MPLPKLTVRWPLRTPVPDSPWRPVDTKKLLDKFDFEWLYLTLTLVQPFTILLSPDELRKKAEALVEATMIQHVLAGEQAVDGSYEPSGGFRVYCAPNGIRLSFELCSSDITKGPNGEWG